MKNLLLAAILAVKVLGAVIVFNSSELACVITESAQASIEYFVNYEGEECLYHVIDSLENSFFEREYRGEWTAEETDMALEMFREGISHLVEPITEVLHMEFEYLGFPNTYA